MNLEEGSLTVKHIFIHYIMQSKFIISGFECKTIFINLLKIYDGTFCENLLKAVNYFCKSSIIDGWQGPNTPQEIKC